MEYWILEVYASPLQPIIPKCQDYSNKYVFWHRQEFNRFKFRIFLLQHLLSYQDYVSSACPTIYPELGKVGLIPFPRVLMPCEIQTALSRFWTQVTMSISNEDNLFYECHILSSNQILGWTEKNQGR